MARAAARRITVCLLSPHPLVLEEFGRLLARPGPRRAGPGFRLTSRRLDATGAALGQAAMPPARVYVVDGAAPRPAVQALVAGILDHTPRARILMVVERLDEAAAFPLLRLGVKGLLPYAEVPKQLRRALQIMAGGGYWVPRRILSRFVDAILHRVDPRQVPAPGRLTRREQDVLNALLGNLSNKEIATRLNVSERTVKFHVSNVLGKFNVRRRADLILLCHQEAPGGA